MKKIVGHSPDYFESLIMRMIFEIKQTQHQNKGKGCLNTQNHFISDEDEGY